MMIVYFPVLVAKKTVNIDAQLIIPQFDEFQNIGGYFHYLFELKTFDLQPVRDLTFFIDWYMFKHFHINTFILQNIFFWILSCLIVDRLLKKIFKTLNEETIFFVVLLYSVYPLFCATLSWGIARKHILAYFFVLLATDHFLNYWETRKSKEIFLVVIYYVASIFSQPITLLWPFWVIIYAWFKDRSRIKEIFRNSIPLYFFFIICTYLNYYYYQFSPTFRQNYESKTSEMLNLGDKILGLGHYVYQLFLPYWPAMSYQLGHWSVLVGLLLFILVTLVWIKMRLDKKQLLIWGGFVMFPIGVVIANPQILSDNYLITPSFGLLVLVTSLFCQRPIKNARASLIFLGSLFLFWGAYTFKESRFWVDPMAYSEIRNFGRRPNCDSAINLARKTYAYGKALSGDVKNYLEQYDCFKPMLTVPSQAALFIYFQTYIIYYENDASLEERIRALKKLSESYYFTKLVLATLLLDHGRESEALEALNSVIAISDKIHWKDYYEPIIANKLYPYCLERKNEKCLQITSHFIKKLDVPWL